MKQLGRDTQRLPNARDPQVMQDSYCRIETTQERYHEIQERYLVLKPILYKFIVLG